MLQLIEANKKINNGIKEYNFFLFKKAKINGNKKPNIVNDALDKNNKDTNIPIIIYFISPVDFIIIIINNDGKRIAFAKSSK